MGDDGVGRAIFADPGRQCAGIDAGEAYDAARLQPLVEMLGRAIVRGIGDVGLEDDANGAAPGGGGQILDILVIGADIADMREGEGDDLAEIGGIGENFLIAGQRRVETDLGLDHAGGADALALDHGSIRQHQKGSRRLSRPGARRAHRLRSSRSGGQRQAPS